MLHKFAIWLLLPAMLLNGLWMVCSTPDSAESPMSAAEKADCIRICAALEAQLGRICVIWPGAPKSISVIDYGAAVLPEELLLKPAETNEQLVAALPALHWDPVLSNLTPPPKA